MRVLLYRPIGNLAATSIGKACHGNLPGEEHIPCGNRVLAMTAVGNLSRSNSNVGIPNPPRECASFTIANKLTDRAMINATV